MCNNCGMPISKTCKCNKVLLLDPVAESYIEKNIVDQENPDQIIVYTNKAQLTSGNTNIVSTPFSKPPFDLLGSSYEEISHWGYKVINWFYETKKTFRLSFSGLVGYAVLSLPDTISPDGRNKLANIKSVLTQFKSSK